MSDSEPDISDDEIDICLRSREVIAYRALALATVLRRVSIDSEPPSDADAELFDLRLWSQEQGLTTTFTPSETTLLFKPPATIGNDDIAAIVWQAEGLRVLLWALEFAALTDPKNARSAEVEPGQTASVGATQASPAPPLAADKAIDPSYVQHATSDIHQLLIAMPGPWDPVAPWLKSARLRAEDEIATQRERAEIWHWLAGAELLWRQAGPSDRDNLEDAAQEVITEATTAGLLDVAHFVIREDTARPLASLSDMDLADLAVATAECVRALNWVCGFGSDWDSTPLDV